MHVQQARVSLQVQVHAIRFLSHTVTVKTFTVRLPIT